MPNLIPPITTVEMAIAYHQRIKTQIKNHTTNGDQNDQKRGDFFANLYRGNQSELSTALNSFSPMMSLYLTSEMPTTEITKIKNHSDPNFGMQTLPSRSNHQLCTRE